MEKPKVEYTVKECKDYFKDEIKSLRSLLAFNVSEGKISSIEARKKYDMYLNAYEFLDILHKKEEAESFLKDRTFSLRELYRTDETVDSILAEVAKKL